MFSFNDHLRQVGLYNEHNLAANRIGNLAKSQHIRLEERRERNTGCLWTGVFIGIVVVCMLIITSYPSKGSPSALLAALGCSTLMILGGVFIQKTENTAVTPMNSVAAVQGVIKKRSVLDYTRDHDITQYYIDVNRTSLHVSEEIYAAFVEGQTYILYYEHTFMTLVAAEHVLANPKGSL